MFSILELDAERLFPFLDALAVPASLHDREGRFVHVNTHAEQAAGMRNERLRGRDLTHLVVPEDQENVRAHFDRAAEAGEPTEFGTLFTDGLGNRRYTRAQCLPLKDAGRVVGMAILAWESVVSNDVADAAWLPRVLTPRKHQVLRLMGSDRSTLEIARELGLAHTTVRNHIRDLFTELDAHNREEAVAKAERAGLLPPRPLQPS
jgi:PAS domain S-box-containing protein